MLYILSADVYWIINCVYLELWKMWSLFPSRIKRLFILFIYILPFELELKLSKLLPNILLLWCFAFKFQTKRLNAKFTGLGGKKINWIFFNWMFSRDVFGCLVNWLQNAVMEFSLTDKDWVKSFSTKADSLTFKLNFWRPGWEAICRYFSLCWLPAFKSRSSFCWRNVK